jgi:hypothetical protein
MTTINQVIEALTRTIDDKRNYYDRLRFNYDPVNAAELVMFEMLEINIEELERILKDLIAVKEST